MLLVLLFSVAHWPAVIGSELQHRESNTFHTRQVRVRLLDRDTRECGVNCLSVVQRREQLEAYWKRNEDQLKRNLEIAMSPREEIDTFSDLRDRGLDCASETLDFHKQRFALGITQTSLKTAIEDQNSANFQTRLLHLFASIFNQTGDHMLSYITDRINITTTDDNSSILKCYYNYRARITDEGPSRCYMLHQFAETTLEIQYHMIATFQFIISYCSACNGEMKSLADNGIRRFKALQEEQFLYMARLCRKSPSHVIPESTSLVRPCARGVTSRFARCDALRKTSLPVTLNVVEGQKLGFECGGTEQSDTEAIECEDATPRMGTNGYYYYFSTKMQSVDDPYREFMCQLMLNESVTPETNHRLIFIDAVVCNIETPHLVYKLSGYDAEDKFHRKLNFPIYYNPNSVGLDHPRPFLITGAGLYKDQLGRISVSIFTSKNLAKFQCASTDPKLSPFHSPSFPTFCTRHTHTKATDRHIFEAN